jgi:Ca2+-binding EF-hand superfamily protein
VVTVEGVEYGDLDQDGQVDANETAELSADAMGLWINDVDFGFALLTPTLAALPGFSSILPKFYAVKAHADSAGLVGLGEWVEAQVADIAVNVNYGTAWPGGFGPPTVDWDTSFPAEADADGDGHIDVNELVAWRDADGSGTLDTSELGGVTDANEDGILSAEEILAMLDTNADGRLQLDEMDGATVTQDLDGDGCLDLVADVDLDGDGKLDPVGYEVKTGGDPVYIDFDWPQRIEVVAERVFLQVSEYVYLEGCFSFC